MVRINFWMIFIVILMSYSIPLYSEEKGKRKVMQWEVEKAEPLSPAFNRSKRKTNWLRLWFSLYTDQGIIRQRKITEIIEQWNNLKRNARPTDPQKFKSVKEEKMWIIDRIAHAADPDGLPILIEALNSKDEAIQAKARKSIILYAKVVANCLYLEDTTCIPILKKILREFLEDKDLRKTSAIILAFLRDTASWRVLKEHPNPDALMALGTEESIMLLEEYSRKFPPPPIGRKDDPWCEIPMTHLIGSIYSWKEIMHRLNSDNFILREIALIHLMRVGTPKAIELIRGSLNDPNPYVREHAQEVLDFLPTYQKFIQKEKELQGGEK